MFARVNNEGVVFVEEGGVGGQALFEEGANFLVGGFGASQRVTLENAPSVGIDDEDFMIAGVQEDGVGGFRANAVDGKELLAELAGGGGQELVERALVVMAKEANEGLEFPSFLAEIAGGADELSESREGNAFDGRGGEELFAAEPGEGALDVGPSGVLGEDGADDDFETGPAGPPVLRAMGGEERVEVVRNWRAAPTGPE